MCGSMLSMVSLLLLSIHAIYKLDNLLSYEDYTVLEHNHYDTFDSS